MFYCIKKMNVISLVLNFIINHFNPYDMNTLNELLKNQLRMLYSVEDQMIEALPDMIEEASDEQLKMALKDHLEETKNHKERLKNMEDELAVNFSNETCYAMNGLRKEAKDFLDHRSSDAVKDAGIIVHAQQIEHHEIAGYGSACAFAGELGYDDLKSELEKTLEEEKKTDEKLDYIAMRINSMANEYNDL